MEDVELYEVLSSYKNALDNIIQRLSQLEEDNQKWKQEVDGRINELNNTLFEDILNPAKEAMAAAEHEEAFNAFKDRHGEKFTPYLESTRAIEGDDFDLVREAFDNYSALEGEKPTEDEYVEVLLQKVADQVNTIKDALGAESVEIEAKPDGEVEVKADGEEVETKSEGEGEGEAEETVEDNVELVDDESAEDKPEDVEALEKELEAYKG